MNEAMKQLGDLMKGFGGMGQ